MAEARVADGSGGLELFSDFACPFCYLAEAGAARLEAEGYAIDYRAFELRPAPAPLEAPGADPMKLRGWEVVVAPMAAAAGLTMHFPSFAVRTRKAHEAARYARLHGVERGMRDALFAAYFAEGQDIGRIDVLVMLGEQLGLDRTDLKVNLDIDQYTDAVLADEQAARETGLDGVPAYVMGVGPNRRVVVGLQEYDRLLAWVRGTK